jgi:hypothetical protein
MKEANGIKGSMDVSRFSILVLSWHWVVWERPFGVGFGETWDTHGEVPFPHNNTTPNSFCRALLPR